MSFLPCPFTQQGHSTPSSYFRCPAWLHTELHQPLWEEGSTDGGNTITQIPQEMAKEVLLMAQSWGGENA